MTRIVVSAAFAFSGLSAVDVVVAVVGWNILRFFAVRHLAYYLTQFPDANALEYASSVSYVAFAACNMNVKCDDGRTITDMHVIQWRYRALYVGIPFYERLEKSVELRTECQCCVAG